jgi:hypothetical protein
MKKILFAVALFISATAFANVPNVDELVEKKFRETFPTASAVNWYENKEGYEVLFVHNKVQCRLKYNTEGTMVQMRRDYLSDALPVFIQNAVQNVHPNKTIYGVTEITTADGITFHMILEDQKRWTFVESTAGGQLTTVKRLRKS